MRDDRHPVLPDLFGPTPPVDRSVLPPSAPVETSEAAAAVIAPRAGTKRGMVYRRLVAAGLTGCTEEDLERQTGLDANTVRPRIWELCGKSKAFPYVFVEDSGQRRHTVKGCAAIVWVAVPHPYRIGRR